MNRTRTCTLVGTVRRAGVATATLLLVGAAGTGAQVGPELVTTRHQISVAGRALAYTADAGRLPIRLNETGEALGDVFFVHYAVAPEPGEPPRPLTFLWNGGPGANSVLVHLLGFGPRRIGTPDTPLDPPGCDCALADNDGTWLGFTDLVFLDPVGTGFSRPRGEERADRFYSARADAAYIAEAVRLFVQRFDRWDAPLFLGGESYGTWRAAGATKALEERGIRVAGVLLVSGGVPVGSVEQEEMRVAKLLPARTAAAFWHRRLAPDLLRDLAATLAEAERWATDVYAPALARRDSLDAAERRAIIEGLARYTGLRVDALDPDALVVNRQDFQEGLLRDRGVELARFDTRVPVGGPEPPEGARAALVGAYLRDSLGYHTDAAYLGLEDAPRALGEPEPVSPGMRWRYDHFTPEEMGPPRLTVGDGPPGPRPAWLREALDLDPAIRVYVATGHFDSLNSCALNAHLVAVLPPTMRDAFSLRCYEGGHAMYQEHAVRLAMRRDVGAFVRAAAVAWREASPGRVTLPAASTPERSVDGDVVTTRHVITLDGRPFPYMARAGTLPLRGEGGDVRANVFFVAYTRETRSSERSRPLLFAWNGGPGSNAGLLHLTAMGPRRVAMGDVYATADPDDMLALVDNEATWLPATDLVFVDPVGTGYSRPAREEYGADFYDTVGDVTSIAAFIRAYRARFGAEDAPLFLAGESYGALRAASVAGALQQGGVDVSGIVFISGSPGLPGVPQELAAPLLLPALTATAAYHGRLDPSVAHGGDAVAAAREWALGPYAEALARRDRLTAEERVEVRRALAAWTGLPSEAIDADSLVVSGAVFSERLLADRGRILGRYDARLSRPRTAREGIFDPREDASLAPLENRFGGNAPTVIRYLRDTLGYESDLFYVGPFGGAWPPPERFRGDWMSVRWTFRPGPDAPLLEAMTANPALRVLHASGAYDLVTPASPPAYQIDRLAPGLRDRFMVRVYEGGHSFYLDRDSRMRFKEDGAALIRAAVEASARH